jgi:transcriptional regulator with XRE-family HTH domain
MSNSVSFADRLRNARNERGLSQAEMSALAGQSREMVGRYERGEAEPGIGVLLSLEKHGFDAAFLLTGKPHVLTQEEETLVNAFRSMDAVTKAGLMGMVRGVQSEHRKSEASAPTTKPAKKSAK